MNSKKLSAALLFSLPLLATPALAETHTAPGAICQVNSVSSQPSNFLSYYSSGRAFNNSSGTLGYVCPLNRIVTSSLTEALSVTVYTVAAHYDTPVCCTAAFRDTLGNPIASSGSRCTTSSSTNTQALSLSVPSAFSLNGYLSLNCSVPGVYNGNSSSISSIYYSE